MCYLALIQRLPVPQTEAEAAASFATIQQAILPKMDTNHDGYALGIDGVTPYRTLNATEYKKQFAALPFTWQRLIVHFRMGTIGGVTQANVHLWEIDGVRFAHNGIIHGYGTLTESDSLCWFRKFRALLGNTPTHKSIRAAYKKLGNDVQGRFFLQLADGTVHGLGDWTCYRVGSFLVVSSVALEFSKTEKYGDLSLFTAQPIPSSSIRVDQWWEYGQTIKYIGKVPEKVYTYAADPHWDKAFPRKTDKKERARHRAELINSWPDRTRVKLTLGSRAISSDSSTDGNKREPALYTAGTIIGRKWKSYKYSGDEYQVLLVQWDQFTGGHVGVDKKNGAVIAKQGCTWVEDWQLTKQTEVITV